ncbi:hypothetical protein I5907_20105 [Panacibacter sp. DH6]|uniref:Uncharacterized protein n=1 Tax=Panacibacter microcysteis TaxID=2793269 RepID=A0A931H048_9BACT|nr:hypothetical protein [Panacibacter microcysteis]MBG9378550.1 hypothetical protein [Panacibacter microcysteis]
MYTIKHFTFRWYSSITAPQAYSIPAPAALNISSAGRNSYVPVALLKKTYNNQFFTGPLQFAGMPVTQYNTQITDNEQAAFSL